MGADANGQPEKIGVDKGIPIPATRSLSFYPWLRLDVGDSFLFPASKSKHNCYTSARKASLKHGRKYIIRQTTDGYRCWRTE